MAFFLRRNKSQRGTDPQEQDNIQEGVIEERKLLKLTMEDDELTKLIDEDISNSKALFERMKVVQNENEDYYLGDQLDRSVFANEIPTAENLLYMATETQNSMMTSRRREPFVMPSRNNDESRRLAVQSQQFLAWKWNDENMQIKFEDWVRHAQIYRIGVLKFRFDIERDDFEITNVRPQRIIIDKDATDEYDAKFIGEYKQDTVADLIRMFPKAEAKLKKEFGKELATPVRYLEYWTNEFVVWKAGKVIIDKKKNPNWNWDEKDRKASMKKLRKQWSDKTQNEKLDNILLNFFNEPRKPFVILSLKSLNKNIYADTSDFEQAKVLQDIINIRKRTIDKAAKAGLGRLVISGQHSGITKQEAKKIVGNPTAPLWLSKGKASDAVQFIEPRPMSAVPFQDLQESKVAFDNIWGIHGQTRGERGAQETATGRTILKEGDLGRVDLLVRRIDKKLELVYALMMQFVKVWYTEDHFVKILGSEQATSYLRFSTNSVEDGQEVLIKSELTVDKSSQRQNIMTRAQLGLLDPLTMFEKFDDPNPKESALRLVYFQTDPKLYAQQFLVDENTEGADNDPTLKAKKENSQFTEGEQVPPFEGANQAHIQEHSKFAESPEGKEALQNVEIANNFMQHLQAEVETVKGQRPTI